MTKDDLIWLRLVEKVNKNLKIMKLPSFRLLKNKSNGFGYINDIGYFERKFEDYEYTYIFKTDNEDEMILYILKKAAKDVSDFDEFSNFYINSREEWHYDENGDVLNDKGWKYNLKYNKLKYFFERVLWLLLEVYTIKDLRETIIEYENKLNVRFKRPHWKYDVKIKQFIEINDDREDI